MDAPTPALALWAPPPRPDWTVLRGRFVEVRPLLPRDAATLHVAFAGDGSLWDFMPYGPFPDAAAYRDWIGRVAGRADPMFFALVPATGPLAGRPAGVASWLRIAPEAGSIEVGHIALSAALRRTPAATEAMVLMMGRAFALGYRRYEWKCDARNAASRRAARRLGFGYEGTFRQAAVVKGRNRDTAWFSVLDGEWPALARAFADWLAPGNFDADGRQRQALSERTARRSSAVDPAGPGAPDAAPG